eukprot:jgi/Hompol1/3687/HPOL_001663-RA
MTPYFPQLPAPHSYLSSQIQLHPDIEGSNEREASVQQAIQMEQNLKKLLLEGLAKDGDPPGIKRLGQTQTLPELDFEPVNYLSKYSR